ncbi:hypothetical protein EVG20_g7469 [Dentipellis fragilis]|uniref:Cytochrome P450 n=1 Tax=Dentipellis fragilis TaxID=205917 RepID=A0A4Y9YCM7_9AGAM|nr:hypothetical protein EVG20_g7469 [Dentipellis fragilis]
MDDTALPAALDSGRSLATQETRVERLENCKVKQLGERRGRARLATNAAAKGNGSRLGPRCGRKRRTARARTALKQREARHVKASASDRAASCPPFFRPTTIPLPLCLIFISGPPASPSFLWRTPLTPPSAVSPNGFASELGNHVSPRTSRLPTFLVRTGVVLSGTKLLRGRMAERDRTGGLPSPPSSVLWYKLGGVCTNLGLGGSTTVATAMSSAMFQSVGVRGIRSSLCQSVMGHRPRLFLMHHWVLLALAHFLVRPDGVLAELAFGKKGVCCTPPDSLLWCDTAGCTRGWNSEEYSSRYCCILCCAPAINRLMSWRLASSPVDMHGVRSFLRYPVKGHRPYICLVHHWILLVLVHGGHHGMKLFPGVSSHKTASRRTFPNPRALDHSKLPPEIWLLIIREATLTTPDPLDTSDETSFLDATTLHLPTYYASMRLKMNMSLPRGAGQGAGAHAAHGVRGGRGVERALHSAAAHRDAAAGAVRACGPAHDPGVLAAAGDLQRPPVDPAEPVRRDAGPAVQPRAAAVAARAPAVRAEAAVVDELRRRAVPPADVAAAGDADDAPGVPGAVVVLAELPRAVLGVAGPGGGDERVAAGAAEPESEPGQRDVRGAGVVVDGGAAEPVGGVGGLQLHGGGVLPVLRGARGGAAAAGAGALVVADRGALPDGAAPVAAAGGARGAVAGEELPEPAGADLLCGRGVALGVAGLDCAARAGAVAPVAGADRDPGHGRADRGGAGHAGGGRGRGRVLPAAGAGGVAAAAGGVPLSEVRAGPERGERRDAAGPDAAGGGGVLGEGAGEVPGAEGLAGGLCGDQHHASDAEAGDAAAGPLSSAPDLAGARLVVPYAYVRTQNSPSSALKPNPHTTYNHDGMYGDHLEQLVLSGELFNGASRSSSPARTPSPSTSWPELSDEEDNRAAAPADDARRARALRQPGPGADDQNQDQNQAQDADEKEKEQTKGQGYKAALAATQPEYLSFGHGKHACPGRFFAAVELKAMLAHVVLTYDVRFPPGTGRPPNDYLAAACLPGKADLEFRKRAVAA